MGSFVGCVVMALDAGDVQRYVSALEAADIDKGAFERALADVERCSKEDCDAIAHAYTRGRSKWPTKGEALKAIKSEFFDRAYQAVKLKQVDKASKF